MGVRAWEAPAKSCVTGIESSAIFDRLNDRQGERDDVIPGELIVRGSTRRL
ncbi:hypothetical protein [uncultured Sphingomonas sp.]|uniref:hypothetical protein n=1 Tax=uncultured Sphingomonas sp. TaxID=158754 RepID=UPI0035C96823